MQPCPAILGLLLAAATASTAAQPACSLPPTLDRPESRRPDYRNADLRTDYLAWVLSWSPEHCEQHGEHRRHQFQCSLNAFEFVVHGLWPQNARASSPRDHPRHCRGARPLEASLIRRHLCTVPGADLMQQQWQAHGTCHWSVPEDYFAVIERLAQRYRRPGYAQLAAASAGDVATLKASDVKQAFVDRNPGLSPEHVRVTVDRGNWLKEVWICLTPDPSNPVPRACPRGGTPDGQTVRVRRPRVARP